MKSLKLVFGSLLMMVFSMQISVAQTYNLNNSSSSLKVDGTSNLHDWDIKSGSTQKGKLTVTMQAGKVSKISALEFNVAAESLKSGKSGMDKNTFKALKTNQHKQITYKMTSVKSLNCSSGSSCKATVAGNLTLAGVTKAVDVTFDMEVTNSNITLTGSRKLKMTDFNITPPKALMGTITTGNDVTVVFKSTFAK